MIRVRDAARMPAAIGATNVPVQFTPAQRRVMTGSGAIELVAFQQSPGGINQLAMQHPDEYLFDGGDRA